LVLVIPTSAEELLYGVFIGFILPVLFVLFRELVRTKIEDVAFLERKLRVPLLSTILFNKRISSLVCLEAREIWDLPKGFLGSLRGLTFDFSNPNDNQFDVNGNFGLFQGKEDFLCYESLLQVYS